MRGRWRLVSLEERLNPRENKIFWSGAVVLEDDQDYKSGYVHQNQPSRVRLAGHFPPISASQLIMELEVHYDIDRGLTNRPVDLLPAFYRLKTA